MANPVLVTVRRGELIESEHRGAIFALDADGADLLSVGDVEVPFFPRSAAKPLQALALLRAGLHLVPQHLALACASHSGSPTHIDGVRELLMAYDLSERHLQNTPDLPLGAAEHVAYLRGGAHPSAIAQNCSGKHAAMLATCVINGWDTATYLELDHPLQLAIRATMEELAGEHASWVTIDGCGTPLFAWTYRGFTRAYATLSRPDGAPIAHAMRTHPELVGGEGRDVTTLMRTIPSLVAKDGAEAVFALSVIDGPTVVLKVDDGSMRVLGPVAVLALRGCGIEVSSLDDVARKPVLGHGHPVGEIASLGSFGHLD